MSQFPLSFIMCKKCFVKDMIKEYYKIAFPRGFKASTEFETDPLGQPKLDERNTPANRTKYLFSKGVINSSHVNDTINEK